MTREEAIKELKELDCDELCSHCMYECDCSGAVVRGGPNGPIYPPCADTDIASYIDIENYIACRKEE